MIVCVCHRVSDRDIAHEARAGCGSFDELQDATRVGTGCGACIGHAEATFSQHCAGRHGPQTTCHAWPAAPHPGTLAHAAALA